MLAMALLSMDFRKRKQGKTKQSLRGGLALRYVRRGEKMAPGLPIFAVAGANKHPCDYSDRQTRSYDCRQGARPQKPGVQGEVGGDNRGAESQLASRKSRVRRQEIDDEPHNGKLYGKIGGEMMWPRA